MKPKKQPNESVSEYYSGYNKCYVDWEAHLPSKREINKIIREHLFDTIGNTVDAIHKRIWGEE